MDKIKKKETLEKLREKLSKIDSEDAEKSLKRLDEAERLIFGSK